MSEPPVLALDRVSRCFNGVPAVDRVSFDVASGEFFSLLGPSGCGKTTTLRLIAGFDDPERDGGTIRMFGDVVIGKRPYQRPIGMVFQNYALFPHLNVADNIAFGLEERRIARREIRRRVDSALELMRLDPATYSARRPAELSGGQRQRVALARALVLEPRILLLDEPLAALDPQLRKQMRLELRQLNRTLGITFLLVTHDQEEALVMSDRIAVMSAGRVVQIGAPGEIYRRPRTAFVAEFIGEANIFQGTVVAIADGIATVTQSDGSHWRAAVPPVVTAGDRLDIAVRPEWHELASGHTEVPGTNALPGHVREIIFLGESVHAIVTLRDGRDARVALRHTGAMPGTLPWRVGDPVTLLWHMYDAQVLEQ